MNGFRQMISDRMPKTWDMTLRWCKSRQKWIDYFYNTHIKKLNNDYRVKQRNKLKSEKIMGYFKGTFDTTIETERMMLYGSEEEYKHWIWVIDWSKWFCSKTIFIESMLKRMHEDGELPEGLKKAIKEKYKTDDELAEFILKYLHYDNQYSIDGQQF